MKGKSQGFSDFSMIQFPGPTSHNPPVTDCTGQTVHPMASSPSLEGPPKPNVTQKNDAFGKFHRAFSTRIVYPGTPKSIVVQLEKSIIFPDFNLLRMKYNEIHLKHRGPQAKIAVFFLV